MKVRNILIFFLVLFVRTTAYGKVESKRKGPPQGLSLGGGYIYSESEYAGVKSKHLPMPLVSYIKGSFFIRGLTAGYRFFQNENISSNFLVDSKFFAGGYESDDSSVLSGMDKRKGTILSGGSVSVKIWKFDLKAKIMKDIIGVYGGAQGEVELGFDFPISIFFEKMPFTMVGTSLGTQYNSESYNNYYYGIKASEQISSRLTYITTDSWSTFCSAFLRLKLSKKWTLMSIYKNNWLSSEIENSPIVDKKLTSRFLMLFNYLL